MARRKSLLDQDLSGDREDTSEQIDKIIDETVDLRTEREKKNCPFDGNEKL